MRICSRSFVATVVACALAAAAARPAQADIEVLQGVNNQGTVNVLLNDATNVLTATGTVSGLGVNFTSTSGSGLLNASSAGQAPITGGTGNIALTQLSMGLASNLTFDRAVFNINAATDGSVVLHVEGVNINGGFFEDNFTVDDIGANFFTVSAINGQFMTSISLTAINGATFEDVRQVRLGGGAIPEPTTAMLMGLSLAAVAIARPRKKA
jgi:hypothetical protein